MLKLQKATAKKLESCKASDNPMQEALYNMGVSASKLMQEENPYAKPFSQDNQKAAV